MKQWFDGKLYKEGLRQLRVPGIVCSGILAIISILVLLILQMEQSSYVDVSYVTTRMVCGFNPVLYVIPYGVPTLMVLKLFRFQNQRNASDFYHSIPQTRVCLGISYFAAALTWILGILWGCSLFTGVFAQVLPAADVLWGDSIRFLFHSTTASFLTGAGVFLAASVTGTLFTNLAASAMVLCIPVLIELVLEMNVTGKLDYVYSLHTIFPYMYNTLFNDVLRVLEDGVMGYRSYTTDFHLAASCVYTVCLAAVLYVVGLILFHRRKSESAGQAATGRKTKALFRVLPAFAITLIPVSLFYQDSIMDRVDWMLVVAVYIFAVIVYLLYELFSTGKWKSALQSLKGIWLLVVLDIGALAVLHGLTYYVQKDVPAAGQIDSVSVPDWSAYGYGYNYFDNQIREIRFSGEEWSTFTAEMLEDTIRRDREMDEYWKRMDTENAEDTEEREQLFEFTSQPVVIRAGHKTLYRNLYLTEAQKQKLEQMMKSSETFQDVYMTLPEFQDEQVIVRGGQDVLAADAREFVEVMQQEITEAGFEKWYSYMNHEHDGWLDAVLMDAEGQERVYVPVSKTLTPKTYQTCIHILTENSANELNQTQKEALGKLAEGTVENANLQVQLIDLKSNQMQMNVWGIYYNETDFDSDEMSYNEGEIDAVAFAALLSEMMEEGADAFSGYLLLVSGDIYEASQGEINLELAIYPSAAQAERLVALYRENG